MRSDDITVVLTRSHARELDLATGTKVWLAANRGATTFPSLHAVELGSDSARVLRASACRRKPSATRPGPARRTNGPEKISTVS